MKWFHAVPLSRVTSYESSPEYSWRLLFTGFTISKRFAIGFVFRRLKVKL